MADKLFLVSGATGFIGSHLVDLLSNKGIKVRAVYKNKLHRKEGIRNVEWVKADLAKKKETKKIFDGTIDKVFHVAGLFDFAASYNKLYKANVLTTKNMCESALNSDIKSFIHWSSVGVYGKPKESPIKEEHPKNPRNNYEKTKLLGEQLALKYHKENGLPVTAIRPALVYGPGSKYGHLLVICSLILAEEKFKKNVLPVPRGGTRVQFANVYDVVNAALFLSDKKKAMGEIYNIADNSPLNMEQFMLAMMKPLNLKPSTRIPLKKFEELLFVKILRFMPGFLLDNINNHLEKEWCKIIKKYKLKKEIKFGWDKGWINYFAGDFCFDNSKLKKIGYKFKHPDFRKGIKKTIRWYQDNKWIPRVKIYK